MLRHILGTKQAEEASERKIWIARFRHCRTVRCSRRVYRIGHCQQFDLARLDGSQHGSQRQHADMDAAFGQVGDRTDGIVVRYEGGGHSGAFLEREVSEIRSSRYGIEIEL